MHIRYLWPINSLLRESNYFAPLGQFDLYRLQGSWQQKYPHDYHAGNTTDVLYRHLV